MADYFTEKVEEAEKRIPTMEHMLGKGLLQPFNNTNSGARKIMHGVHRDHVFPLMNGEKAIVETGYEIRFGDLSSSVLSTDSDYQVVGKISKFSFSPNHHYYLIVKDVNRKKLDVIERISYHHITENYGYLYNNSYIDSLMPGSYIPKDTIVQKSLAFDEYNNRKDGCNFNVAYMSLDQNMEDSIIISDEAAKRLTSPLIKPVQIPINENYIPLNLYGDDKVYKCIPDIGEDIKDNILIALRKEKKEEMIFSESVDRLRKIMMSDEKKLLTGKVIDVNIYCNNPENLDSYHNSQFKLYYNELMRMSQEFVSIVLPFEMDGFEISYELEKLYGNSKRILNHTQFIDKKPFSNIILEVVVLEELRLNEGDKASNRYGGKGVVSRIMPKELMPKFGNNESVDIIFNTFTMYNRQNPGQLFELSINHIGHEIIKKIATGNVGMQESFDMILRYLNIIVPEQAEALRSTLENMDDEERRFFLESFIMDGNIHISTKPISDSFDIDRLLALYNTFPWVQRYKLQVPIKDSNGKIRFIEARREIIIGKEYIFRLKQFAEEKFSANSLSATNIKGVNTKSKANKNYQELHSNTPIRFGNMEINNFNHLGPEVVIENLMIHSVSPNARRLVKKFYTENPYHINIELDKESKNVEAAITNTYLKAIGRRLVFKKVKKNRVKITINPLHFKEAPIIHPLRIVQNIENAETNEEYMKRMEIEARKKVDKNRILPIKFYGIDMARKKKQQEINRKACREKGLNPRERAKLEEKDNQ